MNIRIFFLGLVWIGAMFFLFLTPVKDNDNVFFECIPARSIVHFALFLGFVNIWIIACKKQAKSELLRRKAVALTFLAAVILTLLSETMIYLTAVSASFSYWNLVFDLIGSCLGILTFRILYRSYY
ncbi:MAG: hypothetical protein QNK85_09240 [Crocinitomicaceae bacterium]